MQVAVIQKFVLTLKHQSAYTERPLRSMALYSPFRQKFQLPNIDLFRIVTESGHFRNKGEIKPNEQTAHTCTFKASNEKLNVSGYFTEYRLRRPTATAKQNRTETAPMMPPA